MGKRTAEEQEKWDAERRAKHAKRERERRARLRHDRLEEHEARLAEQSALNTKQQREYRARKREKLVPPTRTAEEQETYLEGRKVATAEYMRAYRERDKARLKPLAPEGTDKRGLQDEVMRTEEEYKEAKRNLRYMGQRKFGTRRKTASSRFPSLILGNRAAMEENDPAEREEEEEDEEEEEPDAASASNNTRALDARPSRFVEERQEYERPEEPSVDEGHGSEKRKREAEVTRIEDELKKAKKNLEDLEQGGTCSCCKINPVNPEKTCMKCKGKICDWCVDDETDLRRLCANCAKKLVKPCHICKERSITPRSAFACLKCNLVCCTGCVGWHYDPDGAEYNMCLNCHKKYEKCQSCGYVRSKELMTRVCFRCLKPMCNGCYDRSTVRCVSCEDRLCGSCDEKFDSYVCKNKADQ